MLQGRVMGTEEANARLREQVARQVEEFSIQKELPPRYVPFLLFIMLVSSFSACF